MPERIVGIVDGRDTNGIRGVRYVEQDSVAGTGSSGQPIAE
jgi:hypothetical protein